MSTATSDIYVWVWLPGETNPVAAGVLTRVKDGLRFAYGNTYLGRPEAVSLSPTLPLGDDWFGPTGEMGLPSALRDAAPDAWGRRVILNRLAGHRGRDADTADLDEGTYLLKSDSNRIGALDFQVSPRSYVARLGGGALSDLQVVAELISAGEPVPPDLHDAFLSGTGIGGARPKALVQHQGVPALVKFSLNTDVFPAVEAEALAANLARRCGQRTPGVSALTIGGKYALIAERFDRGSRGERRMLLSALTIVGRTEAEARYGSYPELVSHLMRHAERPEDVGPELFTRIAFNMAISNNDDHLRNHASFWNGHRLILSPAYDLAPAQRREGAEITQTLAYGIDGEKLANFGALIHQAHLYNVSRPEALRIVHQIRQTIADELDDAADEMRIPSATLSAVRGSFLHPTVTRDLSAPI